MTEAPVNLFVVEGADGQRISVGPRQAHWLRDGGFIERTDHPYIWRALQGLTMDQVNELVMSQAELRECEFCRKSPAGWRINCRPFTLGLGPYAGARLGGPDRPLFACDVCARYVRENRKRELIDYAIASTVEHARAMGGYMQQVAETHSWQVIKQHLTPAVREVVYGMFSHRIGLPERDDNSTSEAA